MPSSPDPEHPAALRVNRRRQRVMLVLSGSLDRAAQETLSAAIAALEVGDAALAVDLTEVDFLDCSGLTVLVELRDRCAGMPTLIVPSPEQRRLLELTGLDRAFRVVTERGAAGLEVRSGKAGLLARAGAFAVAVVAAAGVAGIPRAEAHGGAVASSPTAGAALEHAPAS